MNGFNTPADFLTSIPAFIVAIGILVAVHEFGHFWVARKLGIRVLRFSIGFGRALWKRVSTKDQVEYVIAAIPLGGYVKLLDEREGNVDPADAPYAFNRQPVWKRIAVLLAGPAFNLIFAVLLYWALFVAGVPGIKAVVGSVSPDSLAAHAGLRADDQIVAVAGTQVSTVESATLRILDDLVDDGTINMRVRGADGGERAVTLDTGHRSRELTQPGALYRGLGFDYWQPRVSPVVGVVSAGGPADRAGLKMGDEIRGIDGAAVHEFADLIRLIEPSAGRTVNVQVKRQGQTLQMAITVGEVADGDRKVGRIGVGSAGVVLPGSRTVNDMVTVQKFGVFAALGAATKETYEKSAFTLHIMGRLITGDVSLKAISGAIGIAETAGQAVRSGWRASLITLALISISLGILNLLPIPILDGGQVVYQLAELVKGKPVSERALLLGQQIGIAMLILMMTLAFYNDIARHLN
jgi:regulator of sigma E protease